MSVSNTPPPSSFCFLKIAFLHRRSKNNNKKKRKETIVFQKEHFSTFEKMKRRRRRREKLKADFYPIFPDSRGEC